jgi:hypothetical protein
MLTLFWSAWLSIILGSVQRDCYYTANNASEMKGGCEILSG